MSGIALRWDELGVLVFRLGVAVASAMLNVPLRLRPSVWWAVAASGSEGDVMPEQDERRARASVAENSVKNFFFMVTPFVGIALYYIIQLYGRFCEIQVENGFSWWKKGMVEGMALRQAQGP